MKLIGRAALWLIDKLVYLLIGNKDFDFTSIPDSDDWPPDGSMHFMRLADACHIHNILLTDPFEKKFE